MDTGTRIKTPPRARRVLYRMGMRMPERWRPWVQQDMAIPGWSARQLAGQLIAMMVAMGVGFFLIFSGPSRSWLGVWRLYVFVLLGVVVGNVVSWMSPDQARRERRYHLGEIKWVQKGPLGDVPLAPSIIIPALVFTAVMMFIIVLLA